MTLDDMWTRALAYLLGWAYDCDVSLVHVWGAICNKMPEEYWLDDETLMTNTLKLLKHCLEEGYLVAGNKFRSAPEPPPGLSPEEKRRWEEEYVREHGPMIDWRPWDMGHSEALKKIAREWKAIEQPFSDPTAMYCVVTLVPTIKARREYDWLHKKLRLDEEKDEDD